MHRRLAAATAVALALACGFAAEVSAIPLPGTPAERANTSTPLPPDGDQCSYSPDTLGPVVDWSYSCYGHDLCWQNGSYDGVTKDKHECNLIFRDNMRTECDEQNTGFGSSVPEEFCQREAEDYYLAVEIAAGF
jgi:hypothetical protein